MALVIFRSKVAADITMFAENARRIFEIIGRPESPRGVITAEQGADALQRLNAAVDQEKAQQQTEPASNEDEQPHASGAARRVTFSQRAFPLIEMLRAAQKKGADVTWG